MQKYSPDPLASGGATEKPFGEAGTPKAGNMVTTLLRLAMRRMPAHGYGATKGTSAVRAKDALTMGSHGAIK